MLRSTDNTENTFALNNTRIKRQSFDTSATPHVRKQNVNKVSQKQFEVINMRWRKTKIFVDIEATTTDINRRTHKTKISSSTIRRNTFQLTLPRPSVQISTPSYIEFYYIHEIDDRIKEKESPDFKIGIHIAGKSRIKDNTEFVSNKSSYRFNGNYNQDLITQYPQLPRDSKKSNKNNNFIYYADFFTRKLSTLFSSKSLISKDVIINKFRENKVSRLEILFGNETCPSTTQKDNEDKSISRKPQKRNHPKSQPIHSEIKSPEKELTIEKVLLEHVDQNTGHEHHSSQNKTKYSKKHIHANLAAKTYDVHDKHEAKNPKIATLSTKLCSVKMKHNTESFLASCIVAQNYVNSSASWSEYRFVAVYVYEPLQVHCDAAGISPHWLVTAGSCLARHHRNPGGEGLSAYIAYCGDSWWNPERISYVKYSRVHPRYHPRNRIRRHLYNVGIIKVVNSMVSACPGWSPVSLMSHHFPASSVGPRATAIGWGLDRFDARYTVTDLPKTLLMLYDAPVYSDSCPGNIGYSKAKQLRDEGGVRNVYCLSLPPYNGEEKDPVHGSLLLVGEKLIALYLQEERRPWGEQCALYTGTWRLVPWILENARESEDSDIFTVDI